MDLEELYSFNNEKNYKGHLSHSIKKITEKYTRLCCHYILVLKNSSFFSTKKTHRFVAIRGLDTITYIFQLLLLYTNNIDMAYYHADKSMYLYVEFISQLNSDDNYFLKLSSRDAINYIYKKTIFNVKVINRSKNINNNDNKKIKSFNKNVNFVRFITDKIIANYLFRNIVLDTCEQFYQFIIQKISSNNVSLNLTHIEHDMNNLNSIEELKTKITEYF